MTTIKRIRKYRVEMRENDHAPAHVHVVGADVNAVVFLHDLRVMGVLPASIKNEVMAYLNEQRTELVKQWNAIHTTSR